MNDEQNNSNPEPMNSGTVTKDGGSKSGIIAIVVLVILLVAYFAFFSKPKDENTKEAQVNQEETSETAGQKEINQEKQMDTTKTEPSKLKIDILQEGTGDAVTKDGDSISVDYTGTLLDGTKFDSSIDRGQPFTFTLGVGQVIQGWDKGLIGMKVGEKRKLTIPAELAYGDKGAGSLIKPGATLVFETELISIN